MKKLLIATTNQGKFDEMAAALAGIDFDIVSLSDVGTVGHVEETGSSYIENAVLKAKFYQEATEMEYVLADDSGVVIEALEGELGVHTRRWGAGSDATDEEWLQFFLDRMMTEENKRAEFLCAAALCVGEEVHVFEGHTHGYIGTRCEKMLPGLPLSSVFIPEGFDVPYAALSREDKNKISHRGLAVAKVREFLREYKVESRGAF